MTHVSVRARRDRSLSAIRPWSSGALLTTDLVFSEPNVRLTDDDGPGLTSTPPMIRSSRMNSREIEPSSSGGSRMDVCPSEKHGWPFVCQEEARWYQKKLEMSLRKSEFRFDVCDCRDESDGKMTKRVKFCGEWLFAVGQEVER